MFIPKSLYTDLGGFDEAFFMFGEDLDLCWRVREKGYAVWYNPSSQIIHFKGQSASTRMIRTRYAFYEAMIIFSRKYQHTHDAFFPSWLIYIGTVILAGLNIGVKLLRTFTASIIDLLVINVVLWAGISIRFSLVGRPAPYIGGDFWLMFLMHVLLSMSVVSVFFYRGVYLRERYSFLNTFSSGLIASVIFMASVYLIKSMAFSRIAFALSSLLIAILLASWREVLPRTLSGLKRRMLTTGRVLILGNGDIGAQLIANMEKDKTAQIAGVIWPKGENVPGQFEGYPVLGMIEQTRSILERLRADLLLIATSEPWYSHIIEALASLHVRNLTIRWVPHELLDKRGDQLPEVIPLHDFTV
jgi:hypothetical protein